MNHTQIRTPPSQRRLCLFFILFHSLQRKRGHIHEPPENQIQTSPFTDNGRAPPATATQITRFFQHTSTNLQSNRRATTHAATTNPKLPHTAPPRNPDWDNLPQRRRPSFACARSTNLTFLSQHSHTNPQSNRRDTARSATAFPKLPTQDPTETQNQDDPPQRRRPTPRPPFFTNLAILRPYAQEHTAQPAHKSTRYQNNYIHPHPNTRTKTRPPTSCTTSTTDSHTRFPNTT